MDKRVRVAELREKEEDLHYYLRTTHDRDQYKRAIKELTKVRTEINRLKGGK